MINKKRENKKTNSFKSLNVDCNCAAHCFCGPGINHNTDVYYSTEPMRRRAWEDVRINSLDIKLTT